MDVVDGQVGGSAAVDEFDGDVVDGGWGVGTHAGVVNPEEY